MSLLYAYDVYTYSSQTFGHTLCHMTEVFLEYQDCFCYKACLFTYQAHVFSLHSYKWQAVIIHDKKAYNLLGCALTTMFCIEVPNVWCFCVTRCAQNYSYTHLSAGDLLREERSRTGSEFGQLIDSYIKEGKIVPVEITINLLKKVVTCYTCLSCLKLQA